MKTGKSSLNVNAAVYIPLSERGAAGETHNHPITAKESESKNASVGVGSYNGNTTVNYHPSKVSEDSRDHKNQSSEVYSSKRTNSHGSYASSSKSPKEVPQTDFLDDDFEMDLLYLQMKFPEFDDESLTHIYIANSGDLENTTEMLKQLEIFSDESYEVLPDTSVIGDTSEPPSSKECTSLKLKEVADEVAGSSGFSNVQP